MRTRSAALVLLVVAWVVYHPALERVFAWDQIVYFAELDGSTSLADGLHHYDYAATRRYWKGDDALFRPLLFTWLALGNTLFSYHHVAWNVANAGLHVLVALFLFRLLITIRPSPFALPVAVLFLVLKSPLELVVWNHLGGYLLACLFLAIGLRAFVQLGMNLDDHPSVRTSIVYVLAFTAASLCHEAMVPAAALAAILLMWMQSKGQVDIGGTRRAVVRSALALTPVVLFSLFYSFHTLRIAAAPHAYRSDADAPWALDKAVRAIPRSAQILWRWTEELAVPSALALFDSPFERFGKRFAFSWRSPRHLFDALLALMTLLVLASSISRRHLARVWPLLILLTGSAFAYAALLSLGRAPEEIADVAYYPYLFGILLVTFAYSLVDFGTVRGWRAAAAGVVIGGLIIVHATGNAAVVREVGHANHYASLYLTRVIRFVDAHKSEPDFTFMILPHPETLDPVITLRDGYASDPKAVDHRRRVTEILFAAYYDQTNPKYVLDASASKLTSRDF